MGIIWKDGKEVERSAGEWMEMGLFFFLGYFSMWIVFLFKRISLFTVLPTLLPVIVLIKCFIYGNLPSKFYACIVLTTERFIWSLNIFSRGE